VTQPLKYARHKNSNRIYFMLGIVWFVSIAVASPIVAGLNDTADRQKDQCAFNNETFLIYSSMFSFYIPTILMCCLYYKIFLVIRSRAKKSVQAAANARRRPSKKDPPNATSALAAALTAVATTTVSRKTTNAAVAAVAVPNENTARKKDAETSPLMTASRVNGECMALTPTGRRATTPVLLDSKPSHVKSKKEETGGKAGSLKSGKNNSEKINLISAGIFKLKNSEKLIPAKNESDEQASSSCSESNSALLNNNNNNNNHKNPKLDKNNNSANVASFNNPANRSSSLAVAVAKANNSSNTLELSAIVTVDSISVVADYSNNHNGEKNRGDSLEAGVARASGRGGSPIMNDGASAVMKATSRFKAAGVGVLRAQSSAISVASSNKERKVTKTLAIVLIVFLVCW
jgi:hypothetical protein